MWKKTLSYWAKYEIQVSVAALIIAIVFPLVIQSNYFLTVGTYVLMFSMLSLSLNLITGYVGIASLGQAAFFGIGAYTSAILSLNYGLDFLITLPIATFLAFISGMLIGLPSLRLSGRYLVIVTLGFGEIVRIIAHNWTSLTGGVFGLAGIPAHVIAGIRLNTVVNRYYIILVMFVLAAVVVRNLTRSRTGLAMAAIKGDELAAQTMGVNLFKYKVLVFATSAAIAGSAGAFFAHFVSYIDAFSFTFGLSLQILCMTIIGGLGTIAGSILGALIYSIIPELLRTFAIYRQVVYGLILVFIIVFRPNGILGGFSLKQIRLYGELRSLAAKNNEPEKVLAEGSAD